MPTSALIGFRWFIILTPSNAHWFRYCDADHGCNFRAQAYLPSILIEGHYFNIIWMSRIWATGSTCSYAFHQNNEASVLTWNIFLESRYYIHRLILNEEVVFLALCFLCLPQSFSIDHFTSVWWHFPHWF